MIKTNTNSNHQLYINHTSIFLCFVRLLRKQVPLIIQSKYRFILFLQKYTIFTSFLIKYLFIYKKYSNFAVDFII